jgi:hypothetical protein
MCFFFLVVSFLPLYVFIQGFRSNSLLDPSPFVMSISVHRKLLIALRVRKREPIASKRRKRFALRFFSTSTTRGTTRHATRQTTSVCKNLDFEHPVEEDIQRKNHNEKKTTKTSDTHTDGKGFPVPPPFYELLAKSDHQRQGVEVIDGKVKSRAIESSQNRVEVQYKAATGS